MGKILKYLKQHIMIILVIIALLVLQAVCDLALPQYTSNIVDIGIQQGGIESAVPEVIRQGELDKLALFMNAEDAAVVKGAYTLIDTASLSDSDLRSYKKKYPVIISEPVCELTEKDKDKLDALEKILDGPMMVVSFLTGDSEELNTMKEEMFASMGAAAGADGENADIISMLAMMPLEKRLDMEKQMEENLGTMSETMLSQIGVTYVKAEYESIGIDTGKLQNNYLWMSGAKMLGVSLLIMLTMILVGFLAAKVAAKIGMELRGRVFKKVVSFSNAEIDRFSTASLITRSTNDIQQVQMVIVMLLRLVFYAPILGIGGIIKVMNNDTSMAWIIFVAVAAILCLVTVLFVVAMPKFKIMQTLVDKVNLVMREILTGLPVIRAFSTVKHEEKRFDDANRDLTRTMLFTNRAMTFMMPVMMLIMNCIMVMILWFGAKGVNLGNIQVGDMIAFMTYTMQIVMSFLMITMVSIMLPRAAVSANRIDEIITTGATILDPEQPEKTRSDKKGVVEFNHVSFCYPEAEQEVLTDITFTALPGQTTAFIGSTGSGKSTLINLIPRFYDVTKGSVRIDGVDVRNMTQHELRSKLGYVPQKGILFSGTVASNLRFGKEEATDEEIRKAASIAQAEDFINEKMEKFDAPIAQGGGNVSGGQKQRLSIARAIAKDPEIYVFDDSFSALDYKTDVTLRKALKDETKNATVLIVAQRISTIMHAEQIIVLDDGKIAGIGTHEELLADNEVYQQIAMSQLSKEELSGKGGMANE